MTRQHTIAMTRWERKDRLSHGAQKRVAERLGIDQALVSRVVNTEKTGVRHAGIEQAVADEIGLPVEAVFPPKGEQVAA